MQADASAYTEEAIAASRAASGGGADGGAAGRPKPRPGRRICPSSGAPCDCGGGGGKALGAADGSGGIESSSEHKDRGLPPLLAAVSAEPIFPPELRRRTPPALELPGPVASWHRPTDLESLLALKARLMAVEHGSMR